MRLTLLAPALIAATLLAPAPALAWQAYLTEKGDPLHWTTTEHHYRLDENLPAHFDAQVTADLVAGAFQQWSDIPCRPMGWTSQGYASGAKVDPNDGVHWIRWVYDWAQDTWTAPLGSKLIAVTWVHFDTRNGEIGDVDMDFNVGQKPYLAQSQCQDEVAAYDFLATMTHEAGHWIGLDHSSFPDATMQGLTFHGDCQKRTLTEDDLEGFCGIYAEPPPPEDLGGEPDAGGSDGDTTGSKPKPKDDGCAGGAGGGGLWPLAGLSLLALRARRRDPRGRGPARAR